MQLSTEALAKINKHLLAILDNNAKNSGTVQMAARIEHEINEIMYRPN